MRWWAQVKTDDDRYKYLSIDNLTSDQQKADVDFKNHNESYKFFFTVTKGNNLYLQYRSLYARDVPKYRLHRGVLHSSDFCKRLMVVKVAGKYLACLLPGLYIKGLIGKSDLSRGIVLCWNVFSCRVRLLIRFSLCYQRRNSSYPLQNTKKLTGWLSCLCAEDVETWGVLSRYYHSRIRFRFRFRILSNRWHWRGEFWFFAYSNVFTSYNQETRNCKGSISCG